MNEPRPGNALRELLKPGPGCFAPEDLLTESIEELSAVHRARLESHLNDCAICAAERRLAREFDASPDQLPNYREDVDFVAARLSSAGPLKAPVVALRRRSIAAWTLAAAAVLLVASVGVFNLDTRGPALPDRASTTTLRGGMVELIAPLGESAEWPRALEWRAFQGAASYRVEILAPDGSALTSETVADTRFELGALTENGDLRRATVYSWSVTALGPEGESLAGSDRVSFVVEIVPRGS